MKRIVIRLRQRWPEVEIEIRADAGFAVPALYDYCEAEGIIYTVGLITNPRLERLAEDLLDEAKEDHQTEGEKARLFSAGLYAAASWERERRVVYKAEAMEKGTNTRFVVSTRTEEPKELYEWYVGRAQSENHIKDFKLALKADRLSCHRFIANQFRLLLHAAAYWAAGHLEEKVGCKWSETDAVGYLAAVPHQGRREGQRAAHEGPAASGLWASRTTSMACSFASFR